ncbi:MAG TPA: PqqD family protein [Polyangiaceae bacterium]|nr:PqqD family protein [Polyangiaceae bacterium]
MSPGISTWRHGRLRCADAVHTRLFDDELVILDLAKGQYFSLDPIGVLLWSGLEAGRPIEQIAADVATQYDVDASRALADLIALGDELVAEGLMVQDDRADRADRDRGRP